MFIDINTVGIYNQRRPGHFSEIMNPQIIEYFIIEFKTKTLVYHGTFENMHLIQKCHFGVIHFSIFDTVYRNRFNINISGKYF